MARARNLSPKAMIAIGLGAILLIEGLLVVPIVTPAELTLTGQLANPPTSSKASVLPGANWETYLGNIRRTSNSTGEVLINTSDVHQVKELWAYKPPVTTSVGEEIAAQPIAVNGVVYGSSWDGYEFALSASNGSLLWKTYVGTGPADLPAPYRWGPTSTATWANGTLYVGGGNSTEYALNASTGQILMERPVGKGPVENYYIWSSPLVTKDFVYQAQNSWFDSPFEASGLNQYYRSNFTLDNYFNSSYPEVNASDPWSSPSMVGNTIYITTGNPWRLGATTYSESIIALNASTLQYINSYQVNKTQRVGDGDFGATPTAFIVHTAHGSVGMVAATNKNGIMYAVYQSNMSLAWDQRVGIHPGDRTVISAAWNGQYLFDMAGKTKINGTQYNGSIRAFEPLTGKIAWQVPFNETWSPLSYAAPMCFNGMVAVADNKEIYIFNATDGALLWKHLTNGTVMPGLSISRGELYAGTSNGWLLAFGLPSADPSSKPAVAVPTATLVSNALHGAIQAGTLLCARWN